jgi:hypothetical protein
MSPFRFYSLSLSGKYVNAPERGQDKKCRIDYKNKIKNVKIIRELNGQTPVLLDVLLDKAGSFSRPGLGDGKISKRMGENSC